jgi:hypothetical protein
VKNTQANRSPAHTFESDQGGIDGAATIGASARTRWQWSAALAWTVVAATVAEHDPQAWYGTDASVEEDK